MKNISISIAFILSAVALACLSGASYLGSVLDQTAPLEAAMRAGGFFVAGIIASLVAIHAKKMRPDVKRWRLIELFCVAVMILVAAALSSGAVFGINFLSSGASLRREARQDIKALENEIATFRQKASEELQVTVTGLSNLYRYHSTDYGNVDAAVKVFVRSKVLNGQAARTLSPASIRGYQTHMQECIDRLSTDPYINRADAFSEALANCHRMIEEWKPDQVAELADSLNAVALRVALSLDSLATLLSFPRIESWGARFVLAEGEPIRHRTDLTSVEWSVFSKSYQEVFANNQVRTLVWIAVLVMLYMFNYMISLRTLSFGAERGVKISDKHGLPLC